MSAWTKIILTVFVLLAYLPSLLKFSRARMTDSHRSFVLTASTNRTEGPPEFQAELITPGAAVPSVHVASICEAPDGRLCAAWYGGSHEGARDVNIYWSWRSSSGAEAWSKPEVLVSKASASRELRRPVKKVGNAVLFADHQGLLRLVYVTVSIGGWSTSSLNVKTSADGGRSWSLTQRLTLSPFFNLSELVKNKPVLLFDGGCALPIYHECFGKFPEVLWLKDSPSGELCWSKTRIFGGRSAIQPAIVPLSEDTAVAFCRDCSSARKIQVTRSIDRGQAWTRRMALPLPNSDSGLDAVRLSDGRILLAFNDSESGRDKLSLALSADEGQTWSRCAIVEAEPKQEFSYPFLIQTKDGQLHLVYTWKRKAIKHVAFNLAWLDRQTTATYQACHPEGEAVLTRWPMCVPDTGYSLTFAALSGGTQEAKGEVSK